MKNKIPLIIILVLVLAGGGAVASRSLSKKSPDQPITPKTTQETEEKGFVGKMKDALTLGKSMKCTWKQDDANFGTAHIKNDHVYTEVTANGKKMYSIYKDDCSYTWNDEVKQGMKVGVESEDENPKNTENQATPNPFSWETPDIEYSCQNEVIPDIMFVPPTDIEFTNPFEMMKNLNLPKGFEIP